MPHIIAAQSTSAGTVAPEIAKLVSKIMPMLPVKMHCASDVTALLASFSESTLIVVQKMVKGYSESCRELLAETLSIEALKDFAGDPSMRKIRALFLISVAPVTTAFVGTDADRSDVYHAFNLRMMRECYSHIYQSTHMDAVIQRGQDNRISGQGWIPYARGMAVLQHLKGDVAGDSHDIDLALMLGREISYVLRYAEHLMLLKAGGHIFSEDEKSSFVEFLRDNTPEKATV
jgi:hypothetical protein